MFNIITKEDFIEAGKAVGGFTLTTTKYSIMTAFPAITFSLLASFPITVYYDIKNFEKSHDLTATKKLLELVSTIISNGYTGLKTVTIDSYNSFTRLTQDTYLGGTQLIKDSYNGLGSLINGIYNIISIPAHDIKTAFWGDKPIFYSGILINIFNISLGQSANDFVHDQNELKVTSLTKWKNE